MNYRKLGNTNLNVSTICLGTMTWGEQNSQEEGFEQMDYALEKGINFFDTAELYAVPPKKETYGKTEEIIGNWFNAKKNREKIILATKIAGNGLSWIRNGGFQYDEKNITEAIEKSLARLKTDYIDLYQLHWPERKANYFGKLGYQHQNKEEEWNNFEKIGDNEFIDYILPAENIDDIQLIYQNKDNLESFDVKKILSNYDIKNHIFLLIKPSENNLNIFLKGSIAENNIIKNFKIVKSKGENYYKNSILYNSLYI